MTNEQHAQNEFKVRQRSRLIPFLAWAGGKRWFVSKYAHLLPTQFNRYIEPFLGAGSVYFHLQPQEAILGDLNEELICAYRGIQFDWGALERSLKYRQRAHKDDPDYFYRTRERMPRNTVQRASRFIYLNRTCFNGIYRVNRQGKFNVPRGSKSKVVLETDSFKEISSLLQNAELRVSDFEALIDEAVEGDFVFADPPYTVRHNYNGFIKYNEILFSWEDQQRLAATLTRAAQRGVKLICTNANHESVRELYCGMEFQLIQVARNSSISAKSASRKNFEELIVLANI
ncbi:DNA adenine methylase [Chromobacterium rhizoryzae]|uniref:DNA adenine methylase n=1 Tax=Chromobacterium rhizoryzae TaxID=1778675 RepID=UPI001D09134C|nr:Dam family site-specific DNA-(adenine-N6)-methyltransferase [Chromobacterium rhizoryzae]